MRFFRKTTSRSKKSKRRVTAEDIPVGADGYIPVDALRQRSDARNPRARAMDSMRVATTVRPQQLTPEEAVGWWNAPGRSDIVGIDAPADTPVTWKRRAGKAKSRPKTDTKARYYPLKTDIMVEALRIRGGTETPEDILGMYYRDVDAVYANAERAIANGRDPDTMMALADSYSQGLADYLDGIFRATVRYNERGHRDLWTVDRDATYSKTRDQLKRLRKSIADMADAPAPKPKPKTKVEGIPRGKGDLVIYGKRKGEKKFMGFDGEGLTNRVLYYMHFPPHMEAEVAELVAELNAMNPDFEFEPRRSKGSIYGDGDR